MSGYILSVAGVILISAVISVIAPSGQMGKFVKSMTRLFIFVVLIAPFVRFAKDPEAFLPSAQFDTDEHYLATYSDMLSRSDEREIAAMLELPTGTVKTRLARAKRELKRLLDGEEGRA